MPQSDMHIIHFCLEIQMIAEKMICIMLCFMVYVHKDTRCIEDSLPIFRILHAYLIKMARRYENTCINFHVLQKDIDTIVEDFMQKRRHGYIAACFLC